MTCSVFALRFGARDPARLAEFWSGVLGWAASRSTAVVDDRDARRVRLTDPDGNDLTVLTR